MDPMLLGETISSSAAAITHFGFWMPSGGSSGVAAVEMFRISAANHYQVYMVTKSSNQVDSDQEEIGDVVINSTTPGVFKFDVSGARDLVRYKVKSAAAASIHLQFAQPLWAPN